MSRVVSIESMPNPSTSVDDEPRPTPNSKRPGASWSSIATFSATRAGWHTGGVMLMIPDPMWMLSVIAERVGHPRLVGREVRVLVEEVVLGDPHVLEPGPVGRLHDVELGPQDVLLGLALRPAVVRVVHADEHTEFHDGPLPRVGYGCWLDTDTTSPVMYPE